MKTCYELTPAECQALPYKTCDQCPHDPENIEKARAARLAALEEVAKAADRVSSLAEELGSVIHDGEAMTSLNLALLAPEEDRTTGLGKEFHIKG